MIAAEPARSPRRTAATWLCLVLLPLTVLAAACADDDDDDEDAGLPARGVADLVDAVAPSVVSLLVGEAQGSGVIYDPDGLIVTNAHVIPPGESPIVVVLADGRRLDADLVAEDERSDLAVLAVDIDDPLPAATFEETLPDVGDLAVAIGTPLGFEGSVTAGIISGVDRSIPGAAEVGISSLVGLIQTDAALSPGNSGGALVDADGRVIGINVAAIPPELRAVSIGFAIPSATVVDVVDQLLETGEARHPYLGVQLAPLTPSLAEQLELPVDAGAVVLIVVEEGPAAEAGIEAGDVITEVDGNGITGPGDVLSALRGMSPGDTVEVRLWRDEQMTVVVELGDRPD